MKTRFNIESIELAIGKKWTKTEVDGVIKNNNNLDFIHKSMILSYSNFSLDIAVETVAKYQDKKKRNIKQSFKVFIARCQEEGLDIENLMEAKAQKPRTKKAKNNEVERAVSKLSKVLDIFNMNGKSTIDTLNSIEEEDTFSTEALVKTYKVLYHLFMAKAQGETVTRKTSASYNMEDMGDGTFKKTMLVDDNGNRKIWEETQSHLPDEKAFASALVVLEVIKNLEGGNKEYLTQEEKEARYDSYLDKVEQQKIEYKGREFDEAEVLEVADINA